MFTLLTGLFVVIGRKKVPEQSLLPSHEQSVTGQHQGT